MNASYFVLVAALLTFATGFFVAAIIWVIKWCLMPREERSTSPNSVQLLHIFSQPDTNQASATSSNSKSGLSTDDSVNNNELYQYHYGTN
jgi:hypothetical protein